MFTLIDGTKLSLYKVFFECKEVAAKIQSQIGTTYSHI